MKYTFNTYSPPQPAHYERMTDYDYRMSRDDRIHKRECLRDSVISLSISAVMVAVVFLEVAR